MTNQFCIYMCVLYFYFYSKSSNYISMNMNGCTFGFGLDSTAKRIKKKNHKYIAFKDEFIRDNFIYPQYME